MVVWPDQLPLDLARALCASPGVAYSIHAFISVAESTATQGSSPFALTSAEAESEDLIFSSVAVPPLQAVSTKLAMQKTNITFFISQFL
jgi:hypothetical protein